MTKKERIKEFNTKATFVRIPIPIEGAEPHIIVLPGSIVLSKIFKLCAEIIKAKEIMEAE